MELRPISFKTRDELSRKPPGLVTWFSNLPNMLIGKLTKRAELIWQRILKLIILLNRFQHWLLDWFYRFSKKWWTVAVLLVCVLAPQLALYWKPEVGVYVNATAIAVLVGMGLWFERIRTLAVSVAILPLSSMISLSLPDTSTFAKSIVFYDILLLLTLVYRFWFTIDQPVVSSKLGRRGYLYGLPLMVVGGQLLGGLGYLMLHAHYSFAGTSLPLVAFACVVFGFTEEMLFRGLIQQRARQIYPTVVSAGMSVILYTASSFDHTSIAAPIFAFILGCAVSAIYAYRQNIVLTGILNSVTKLVYLGLLASFTLR